LNYNENLSIMNKIFSNKYLVYSLFTFAGLTAGWLLFHRNEKAGSETAKPKTADISAVWTCSMHPQIRMPEPGKCPICGMDLVSLSQASYDENPASIHFTREAAALADVEVSAVSSASQAKEIRLFGKVLPDERRISSLTAQFPGRIEKLVVNFTGETVRKGQVLAVIYSPDLVTAQQELLETAKLKDIQPEIHRAAKEKLRSWKLSDEQIAETEGSGSVKGDFEILSGSDGIITKRQVNSGDYVNRGDVLFEIADLSSVWLTFEAYESDLPFLRKGDVVKFTVQALPGKSFTGRTSFIDPSLDQSKRVAGVRLEVANPGGILKPGMFAEGKVQVEMKEYSGKPVIPRSAVLWTGKRSIVYVKQAGSEDPVFSLREIELGPQAGENYIVLSGLGIGEEIVTRGAFSVDAAAQLAGKPSMMNQTSTEKAEFTVAGNCDMCKERIEGAAGSVEGVLSASWDATSKKINISFEPGKTSIPDIEKAIAKSGHDTEMFRAEDSVYEGLPECCWYRK
jgi:membrane fusion protein, copper/silver efflux system